MHCTCSRTRAKGVGMCKGRERNFFHDCLAVVWLWLGLDPGMGVGRGTSTAFGTGTGMNLRVGPVVCQAKCTRCNFFRRNIDASPCCNQLCKRREGWGRFAKSISPKSRKSQAPRLASSARLAKVLIILACCAANEQKCKNAISNAFGGNQTTPSHRPAPPPLGTTKRTELQAQRNAASKKKEKQKQSGNDLERQTEASLIWGQAATTA